MDNLVYLGFENDFELSYSTKINNARDRCNDLFRHDKAFVPIHIVNSRFILAVFLIPEKRIVIYDMFHCKTTANKYRTILLCYLNKEFVENHSRNLHMDWSVHATQQQQTTPTYAADGT